MIFLNSLAPVYCAASLPSSPTIFRSTLIFLQYICKEMNGSQIIIQGIAKGSYMCVIATEVKAKVKVKVQSAF
jgi:hypothetical protein